MRDCLTMRVLVFGTVVLSLLGVPICGVALDRYPGLIDLVVNGTHVDQVEYFSRGGSAVVNAQRVLDNVAGAEYYSLGGYQGFVVQYGDEISFVARGRYQGIVSSQPVRLDSLVEEAWGMLMSPLNFLSKAINGSVVYDAEMKEIRIDTPEAPSGLGDVVPQAALLGRGLSDDFTVRQGGLNLANAIDFFNAGYVPDCNANNAGFPYFVIQTPPSPRDNQYHSYPMLPMMDQDEAFVVIGYTPPTVEYFSYRSYLTNRYYPDTNTRDKLYASLGDTINNYNMAQNLGTSHVYGRLFAIISTSNQDTYLQIRQKALESGIAAEDIFLDVIPTDMVKLGLDDSSDALSYLHRASLFNDPEEKAAYLANPTIEILRITPKSVQEAAPLSQEDLRPRGTGVSEQDVDSRLENTLEQLYQAILEKHGADKTATRLDTSVWLEEGNQAIADRKNVLGETRDTLYTKTDSFQFFEDDLIVVFGVNHQKTGKSVYSNVSCYGAEYYNGLGGITNLDYEASAREYLPDVDPELADKFYIWKFARQDLENGGTYVVDTDVNYDYTGINYGDEAFMGFRSYIDKETLVGTVIDEIVRDQAVLFR